MQPRLCLIACILALFIGCNRPSESAPTNTNNNELSEQEQQSTPEKFTHTITTETEYYTTGPQQGRPPDGKLPAGTKVVLVEEAGSYSLIKAEDGSQAYVAADALKPMTENISTSDKDIDAVVSGNNQFAFDLYTQLRAEEGNLFFSPTSISTALAMTCAGARGATESEMIKVLHFDTPQDQLHPAFAALNETLNPTGKTYDLAVANRLWGQKGYGFLPAFLETTRIHYGAELAEVDFVNAAESARKEINTWIEDQTNGKIKDLMPQGVLNELTRLVLTNAIYFKGT